MLSMESDILIRKIFDYRVTSGYEAKAGVFFATIDKGLSHKGITAFLIPFDTPGVMLGRKEDKLGIRATSTCDIVLQDVRVPKKNVLGSVGTGFEIAMHQLQLGRIGVAAQALGIGQASLDLAINYGLKRELFGKHLTDLQLIRVSIEIMQKKQEVSEIFFIFHGSGKNLTNGCGFGGGSFTE